MRSGEDLPTPAELPGAGRADLWYKLVANAFIPAILASVSSVAIDFQDVIAT
ncbi:hypothetical protein MTX35_07035 [Rhodococcus sp. ARC_M12]|uniref:hypothetical protein n=1 Tax=Rhodococcus sp. ARC_M12 TaxID=2928854 RepID=UPI001FB4BE98|nr:hypothetical protein [Rhodococcus sp. ARC_M12]MCJ0977448.1 hypothetical protein [Rhodococcus sp. ARC_M12]